MLMRTPTRWARPKLLRPPGFLLRAGLSSPPRCRSAATGIHELKHDFFRIIAHKDGDRVHLWSRNGRDRAGDFVAIANAVRALPASRIVLDGEAVAHCLEGLPHFHKLLSDGKASACLRSANNIFLQSGPGGVLSIVQMSDTCCWTSRGIGCAVARLHPW